MSHLVRFHSNTKKSNDEESYDEEEKSKNKNAVILSSHELKELPDFEMDSLQMLYLENNQLVELPDNLFYKAPNLKWLDIRNNQINKIPTSIENNNKIETILLQNNHMTHLPNFLGTAGNLKCINLTGNPIVYPSKSIIQSGTECLKKYLQFEYDKEIKNISGANSIDIFPKFEGDFCHTSKKDKNAYKSKSLKKIQNESFSNKEWNGSKQNFPLRKEPQNNSTFEFGRQPADSFKFQKAMSSVDSSKFELRTKSEDSSQFEFESMSKCEVRRLKDQLTKYSNSNKYVKKPVVRNKEQQMMKIEESLLQELWLEKRRELLGRREKVLQDRKSLDALKHWRHNYKQTKLSTPTFYALNLTHLPYDTNLDYVKILTREDIQKDLPDKYKKSIRNRCKAMPKKPKEKPNVEMKISQMMEYMDSLRSEYADAGSEIEEKLVAADEIKKLTELKKKIVSLKIENDKSV